MAKLEEIKINAERDALSEERQSIEATLASSTLLEQLMVDELKAAAASHGDARKTQLVERQEAQALSEQSLAGNEPITVVLSQLGWIRVAKGHDIDPTSLTYKQGDGFYATARGRNNQAVVCLCQQGRAYSTPAFTLPSARGQGEPVSSRFALPNGIGIVTLACDSEAAMYLLASDAGYGYICRFGDMVTAQKKGKAQLTVASDAHVLPMIAVPKGEHLMVAAITTSGRMLVFALDQLPVLPKGKGNKIINIPPKVRASERMCQLWIMDATTTVTLHAGRRHFALKPKDWQGFVGERAQRGKMLPQGLRSVDRVELANAADTPISIS